MANPAPRKPSRQAEGGEFTIRDADGRFVATPIGRSAETRERLPPQDGGGSPPPPPSDPNSGQRKFRAKRNNEHLKAIYSLTNTLGAAVIGAAYILPEIQRRDGPQELDRPGWVLLGLVVIAAGHAAIRWGWRKED